MSKWSLNFHWKKEKYGLPVVTYYFLWNEVQTSIFRYWNWKSEIWKMKFELPFSEIKNIVCQWWHVFFSSWYKTIIRSYHGGITRSHLNSEVKHHWACLVLRWGTTREPYVLNDIIFFILYCFGLRFYRLIFPLLFRT